eukprot:scaffold3228_cov384-Prasinococcus_capsulatus_cf.AAC.3
MGRALRTSTYSGRKTPSLPWGFGEQVYAEEDRCVGRCCTARTRLEQAMPVGSTAEPKLFVGQLPSACTEEEIVAKFKECGEIKSCKILRYLDGHTKGCAMVAFQTFAEAEKAISQFHGTPLGTLGRNAPSRNTDKNLAAVQENRSQKESGRWL